MQEQTWLWGVQILCFKRWNFCMTNKVLSNLQTFNNTNFKLHPLVKHKYLAGRAICALNSQYFVFATQNRVRAKHMPFWHVFCASTGLCEKYAITGVQLPYCAGSRVFCYVTGRNTICWCLSTKKSIASRFSGLWNNAQI